MRRARRGGSASALLAVGVSLWWIVGLRTQGALRAARPPAHRDAADRRRRRPTPTTCSAASATGSSTAATASASRSTRRPTTCDDDVVVRRDASRSRCSRSRAAGDRAVASPRVLRAARRRRHGRRGRRVAVRRPEPVRRACSSAFADDTAAGLALRNTPRAVPLIVLGARRAPRRRASARSRRGGASRSRRGGRGRARCWSRFLPVWRDGYLSRRRRARRGRPGLLDSRPPRRSTRGQRRPACSRSPARLRRVPVGRHHRADHARAHRPAVRRARGAARRARRRRSTCSTRSTTGSRTARSSPTRSRRTRASADIGTIVAALRPRSTSASTRRDPRLLWEQLTEPAAGRARARRACSARRRATGGAARCPCSTTVELRIPTTRRRPAAGRALRRRRTRCRSCTPRRPTQPVVLAGDGDGIVDAAAAGLLDGNQLVLESASLDDRSSRRELRATAPISCSPTRTGGAASTCFVAGPRQRPGTPSAPAETATHGDDVPARHLSAVAGDADPHRRRAARRDGRGDRTT